MIKKLNLILDFFLPKYCTGCTRKLDADEPPVCNDCFENILTADSGRIIDEFDRKFLTTGYIKDFYSPYIFQSEGVLQNVIYSIKYNKKFLAGILLGRKIAGGILKNANGWDIDLIIPVPLHHLKKAERGYNQSEFIAMGLSRELKVPYSKKVIKRNRYTESQTQLNQAEREENVADAFKVKNKKKAAGKNILLVDDVITTGATIRECGRVLTDSGANSVYACSVAIAG